MKRAKFKRDGWAIYAGTFLTGSKALTGDFVPYMYANGQPTPPQVEIWVGPFPSLADAWPYGVAA